MIDAKIKCRDIVGRDVVLTREITTRGGDTHPAGSVFSVSSTWRGRFSLRGATGWILAVERRDIAFRTADGER